MQPWVPAQHLAGGERVVLVAPPGPARDGLVLALTHAGAPPAAVSSTASLLRRSALVGEGVVTVVALPAEGASTSRALGSSAREAEAALAAAAAVPGAVALVSSSSSGTGRRRRLFCWSLPPAGVDPVTDEPPDVVASDGVGYTRATLAQVAAVDPWFRSPVTAEVLRGSTLATVPPDGALAVLGLPVLLPHSEQLSVRIAWQLPPDAGVVLVALRRGDAWMHPPVAEEAAPAVQALARLFGADLLARNTRCLSSAVLWWPACPGGGATVEQWWAQRVGC